MEWRNIYRGIVMGASDIVPGVSGGTIAVLLGIYDRLIAAINGVFSREWKAHLSFLVPLGIGVIIAIFSLSRLIDWLLIHHNGPTFFFFLGLIIGVLPLLFHEAGAKASFNRKHILVLIIGFVLIGSLFFFQDPSQGSIITDRSLPIYILLFFSGFMGSAAMILPGISGSFILLLIGVYATVINGIWSLKFDVILITGAGIFVGMVTMSKVINYLLVNYRTGTFAAIIGMVIGSTLVIFPGWPGNTSGLIISVVTFAIGLGAAYVLGKVEYEA